MSETIILGAGFSKNSGIPVQEEIPSLLIKAYPGNSVENAVSNIIRSFLEDAFGYVESNESPALDDIMTCIDLSTNSGHHLGIGYPPARLRALRRFLVYRIYSILEEYYKPDKNVAEFITLTGITIDGTIWIGLLLLYMISNQNGFWEDI